MIVHTLNSQYEIEGNKMRRIYGKAAPTPRQGIDCDWKQFIELMEPPQVGKPLVIVWSVDLENEVARTTMTSLVTAIDPLAN